METRPIKTRQSVRFVRRGQIVALDNVPSTRTLLEVLREDLACTGTKEGCGEGDCGACTVVLGEADGDGLKLRAVNSCIRLAHSIDGLALWTTEDLTTDPLLKPSRADGGLGAGRAETGMDTQVHEDFEHRATTPPVRGVGLHPVQQAMVGCHGSQCGFCTPGFVMSLFAMYHTHVPRGERITRALAQRELSGNLCRCTGYRPILDAAQQMASLPTVQLDEAEVLQKLEQLGHVSTGLEADFSYKSPRDLKTLLAARAAHPSAQIVAGCTDVGLWITKMHMEFAEVLDVTQARELRRISRHANQLVIGAAVPLEDAFAALTNLWPQLHSFAARFAGLPVRNSGTLGGNVANGSPIGDSMPLLIALNASVVLMSERGERELPLENFYTGYRTNVLTPDEIVAFIKVPLPDQRERGFLRVYKISKRYDDDISAVCLAINLVLSDSKIVQHISIGAGGVAATPMRAAQTQAALLGQTWSQEAVAQAIAILRAEFQPISDMRASSAYRREVLGNLLQRFWLESQGARSINLESIDSGLLDEVLR